MTATPADATSSRRMLASSSGSLPHDEEARADLQSRIAALFQLMFWSLFALIVFLWCLYTIYDDAAPASWRWVYVLAAVGLAAMAFCWRALLVRRTLSFTALLRLDLVYSLGIGAAFGLSAYLQADLRASGYLSLVYSSFTVFARALIVPSTPARTAVASIATFGPMTASALVLAIQDQQDLPGLGYFIGYLLLSVVSIVLATAGSKIIYGLRREATVAQQLGQYTLDRKIDEGGMGTVYLAHHNLLRRPTAVKLLLPERVGAEALARFEQEVQHMSELTHPNNVAVYDYGHSDGIFYYAMEYLGGGVNLEQLVRTDGPQPGGRIVHILTQVCGALHEAHTSGVIHHDIKPANIILCERGGLPDVAKVVDYGLVSAITPGDASSTQVVLGTPAYLAPEAITDPTSVGPSIDLYALGAVGYFLLTGRQVFDGDTAEICRQQVSARPRPPSQVTSAHVPPSLEAIVMQCLEKQPADRFATVAAMRAALAAVVPEPGWDDAAARAWWRAFRGRAAPVPASTMPTKTITVQLDGDRLFLDG